MAVKEGITGPLGMDETASRSTDEQRANAVTVHVKGEDGRGPTSARSSPSRRTAGRAGTACTRPPATTSRFQRALLRGGELDGTRILEQATVDAAFTNQIGDLDFPAAIATARPAPPADFNPGPGCKWGYGLLLNTADVPGMRRAGSGAWAGLMQHPLLGRPHHGDHAASIYSQSLPFVPEEALAVYSDFERCPLREPLRPDVGTPRRCTAPRKCGRRGARRDSHRDDR